MICLMRVGIRCVCVRSVSVSWPGGSLAWRRGPAALRLPWQKAIGAARVASNTAAGQHTSGVSVSRLRAISARCSRLCAYCCPAHSMHTSGPRLSGNMECSVSTTWCSADDGWTAGKGTPHRLLMGRAVERRTGERRRRRRQVAGMQKRQQPPPRSPACRHAAILQPRGCTLCTLRHTPPPPPLLPHSPPLPEPTSSHP